MKRVYVNESWCLGCHLCEYYCAFAASPEPDMARALKNVAIKPRIQIEQNDSITFAVACRHCSDPLCVKSCIAGAIYQSDGVIHVDPEKCVSCYTCILVCPFGAVTPSEKGVIQKCELCVQTASGLPACVSGCPNGAIVFEERE